MQSCEGSQQHAQPLAVSDTKGKRRILAEIQRLEQEVRFLEEELEKLDNMGKASAACNEILNTSDPRPDPLLPITNGPVNISWDRWFEGPQNTQDCRCWIL